MRVPLALFTYNRPDHTERALKALQRCRRFEDVAVTLYSDAAKRPEHEAAVLETRAVLNEFAARHPVRIIVRSRNLGLANSISSSVGELAAEQGRVIVLEDDLVVAPDFLTYVLAALDRYADDAQVLQISGSLIAGEPKTKADTLFLPVTTTWGWATWARAWRLYDPDSVDDGLLDRDAAFCARFTLDGAAESYRVMLRDRLAGRNDSWGILWWYTVARVAGQVVYPRKSLVWNGGFDSSGVHCGGTEAYEQDAPEPFRVSWISEPVAFADKIATDATVYHALRAYLMPSKPSISERFVHKLARLDRALRP